jgi:hypothetical protein
MFSNFVIYLLVLLVVIYISGFMIIDKSEGFINNSSKSNIYESIGVVPSKMLYLTPPNPTQPNVDYQDWLNEVSGYDSGTRGYDNPVYAADVAAGLDTN